MAAISVEPCTFALFGALGDLALRKLFPALYQLDGAGLLHEDTRIIALAREPGSEQEHLTFIASELRRYVGAKELDEAVVERFLARLEQLFGQLRESLDDLEAQPLRGYARLPESAEVLARLVVPGKLP